jgi:transcriptional regulator with XRE-family HTH domain
MNSRTHPHDSSSQPLWHQLRAVRRRENVTVRTMAKRLGVTVPEVKRQEQASLDITLSILTAWARALEIPAAELLGQVRPGLAPDLAMRANLIRAMKTIRAIQERAQDSAIQPLADSLVQEMLEQYPELDDVKPWPRYGTRNVRYGNILNCPINTTSLTPPKEPN